MAGLLVWLDGKGPVAVVPPVMLPPQCTVFDRTTRIKHPQSHAHNTVDALHKAQLMHQWLSYCTDQAPHSYIRVRHSTTQTQFTPFTPMAASVHPPLRFTVFQKVLKLVFQTCMLSVRIRSEAPTQIPIIVPLYIQPIRPPCVTPACIHAPCVGPQPLQTIRLVSSCCTAVLLPPAGPGRT